MAAPPEDPWLMPGVPPGIRVPHRVMFEDLEDKVEDHPDCEQAAAWRALLDINGRYTTYLI